MSNPTTALAASIPGALVTALATLVVTALVTVPAAMADQPLEVSQPYRLSPNVAPGDSFMGIRLLGSVVLENRSMDGLVLGGLSGLAWDEDEARLYALSDAGALFHLRPHFDDGRLARVQLLAVFALRDQHGAALKDRWADAEGLDLRHGDNGKSGDSLVAVSFERHPRIVLFKPDGHPVESLPLPADLGDGARYSHPNKGLESLTWLPGTGFLTAPEWPLAGGAEGIVSLFALDGRSWRYPLLVTPKASLVDMQALADGSLMTLERGHGLMFLPIVISLHHTRVTADNAGQRLAVETLAILDSSRGWSVDNFEGLTRHRKSAFFMVSDDNFSALQKTLLVYFEPLNAGDPGSWSNSSEFEPHHQITR